MNSKAIAAAIAAQFVGVTANGASIAVGPTASLPNSIGKGPALLVYHPTGDLEVGPMRQRNDHLDFPVRLLCDPLNYPSRSDALYDWADALRDRVEANIDLDLPYVAWAHPISMRVELDGREYGDATYDMVEIIVRVLVREIVPTVSA